jgi:O-antigen/teichoic acid export membrane protein
MFIGIARFYGVLEFGQFTTAHTYMTLFFYSADFGFDLLIVVKIARDKANARAAIEKMLPLKLLFSMGSMLAMMAVMMAIPVTNVTRVLMAILSVGVVGNALLSFFLSTLKGFEIFHYETQVSFIQSTGLLVALIVLGIFHVPIVYIAAVFVISRFIGLTLVFKIALRQVNAVAFRFSFADWKNTMRESAPYGIHLIFGALFFTFDTILLSVFLGEHAVGVYQSVFKLVILALVLCDVLVGTLMPTFARFHAEDQSKWIASAKILLKFLVFCGAGIGMVTYVFAEECIRVVYGKGAFLEAIPVLRIFAMILVIRYTGETFGLMLTTAQKQEIRMKIVAGATMLNITANLLVIPVYGVTGAALVSLVTNGTVAMLLMYHSGRNMFGVSYLFSVKFIALAVSTIAVLAWLPFVHASVFIASLIVLVMLGLWASLWFTEAERALAYGMVKAGYMASFKRTPIGDR